MKFPLGVNRVLLCNIFNNRFNTLIITVSIFYSSYYNYYRGKSLCTYLPIPIYIIPLYSAYYTCTPRTAIRILNTTITYIT